MDATEERLTTRRLLDEVRREFGSFERGFLYTAKELLLRPGLTMAAVWRGERALYTGPFRFFMLSFTLYALVWISTGAMDAFWAVQREMLAAQSVQTVAVDLGATYLRHPLLSEFGTVLSMWLATWIWFWGSKLNAAERAALSLYWYGLMNLVQVPLFWVSFTSKLVLYSEVFSVICVCYVAWGAYSAFEPRRWWNALRGVAWWITGVLLWGIALSFAAGIESALASRG